MSNLNLIEGESIVDYSTISSVTVFPTNPVLISVPRLWTVNFDEN